MITAVIVIVFIFFLAKGLFSLFKSKSDTPKESKPKPTPIPTDPIAEEHKQLEYFRQLCHQVIDGAYTRNVLTDITNYELGIGNQRQFRIIKWFTARGIALKFPHWIDGSYPIYYAFFSHDEVDIYFDKYINSSEQERKTIDTEYLTEMNNWREEQAKLYIAEREAEERRQIAERIIAKQRKKQLEKEVHQQLIDNGVLFGDKTKRSRIPKEVVDAVWRKDGGRCAYCGSTENIQLDHIIPFSKGGATTIENLQLLCRKCNIEKSNKIG